MTRYCSINLCILTMNPNISRNVHYIDVKWRTLKITSSRSSGRVRGEQRNMKSMRPPLATIFFMTYFHRAGGPWPPRPPGSATDYTMLLISQSHCLKISNGAVPEWNGNSGNWVNSGNLINH